jgi:hypothetical protein
VWIVYVAGQVVVMLLQTVLPSPSGLTDTLLPAGLWLLMAAVGTAGLTSARALVVAARERAGIQLAPRGGGPAAGTFERVLSTAARVGVVLVSLLILSTGVEAVPTLLEEVERPTVPADGGPRRLTAMKSLEIASDYQPAFVFADGERWFPIDVQDYVSHAQLRDWKTKEVVEDHVTLDDLRRKLGPACKARKAPCYALTVGCDEPESECAAEPVLRNPRVAYVRVARRDGKYARTAPAWFTKERLEGLPFSDVRILVQYWLFYYYDSWSTRKHRVRQWHEGDWEAVTIGFSPTRPRFVAFSEHCAGVVRRFERLYAFEASPRRVVVQIGHGSHANYEARLDIGSQRRPTRWTTCTSVRQRWTADGTGLLQILPLAFGSFEPAADQWTKLLDDLGLEDPPEPIVPRLAGSSPAMSFPGTWGWHDHIQGPLLHRDGAAPVSPGCHHLWRDPLYTIFCQPKLWSGIHSCPNGRKPRYSPNPCGHASA